VLVNIGPRDYVAIPQQEGKQAGGGRVDFNHFQYFTRVAVLQPYSDQYLGH